MKKDLRTVWIVVMVLAVLQIAGGSYFTLRTALYEKNYTYVDCTVVSVQSTQEEDSLLVQGITVSYVNEAGETVLAQMEDFPSSFSVGSTFRARYEQDPYSISAQETDWFTPVFLLVLGAGYGLFGLAALLLRKKMGLYAMEDVSDDRSDPEEEE